MVEIIGEPDDGSGSTSACTLCMKVETVAASRAALAGRLGDFRAMATAGDGAGGGGQINSLEGFGTDFVSRARCHLCSRWVGQGEDVRGRRSVPLDARD